MILSWGTLVYIYLGSTYHEAWYFDAMFEPLYKIMITTADN